MTTLMPRPLLTSLVDRGNGSGDRPAVRVGDGALTRSDLIAAGAAVADEISGATSVAIDATATLETVIAVTGCLMTGVPAVPVPPDSGPAERDHILKDSGAQLWLGGRREDVTLPHVPIHARARSGSTYAEPDPGTTAMIMYTSGTTGAPKGVVLARSAIAAGLDGLAEAWDWSPDDTLVHGLPLFHVHGLILGVVGALRHGSPLVHTVRPTSGGWFALLRCPHRVVPCVRRRISGTNARIRPAPGVGQRSAAGPGLRTHAGAHRLGADRTLRNERDPHHAQHPIRRRASTRVGGITDPWRPHPHS